jgi:hypothetical protein
MFTPSLPNYKYFKFGNHIPLANCRYSKKSKIVLFQERKYEDCIHSSKLKNYFNWSNGEAGVVSIHNFCNTFGSIEHVCVFSDVIILYNKYI